MPREQIIEVMRHAEVGQVGDTPLTRMMDMKLIKPLKIYTIQSIPSHS